MSRVRCTDYARPFIAVLHEKSRTHGLSRTIYFRRADSNTAYRRKSETGNTSQLRCPRRLTKHVPELADQCFEHGSLAPYVIAEIRPDDRAYGQRWGPSR